MIVALIKVLQLAASWFLSFEIEKRNFGASLILKKIAEFRFATIWKVPMSFYGKITPVLYRSQSGIKKQRFRNSFWNSYFCVSLIGLLCCFPPIGLFSVYFSWLSFESYKKRRTKEGKDYATIANRIILN